MKRHRHSLLALHAAVGAALAAMLSLGCAMPEPAVSADKRNKTAQGAAGGDEAAPSQQVLATVGSLEITEQEVAELMAAQLLKVDRERSEIVQQGVERLLAERLVELEAQERSLTTQELLAEEVESAIDEPTSEQIDAFYEQRKARIRQPKEQVVDQIKEFLRQQGRRDAYDRFIAELKAKHPHRVFLEPFRVAVESQGHPTKGPDDAPVTIVEFSDFECPYCARVNPALDQVLQRYGDKVRLVFRQFPLNNIHPNAQKAAEAALCAHDQEKFWPMHDAMFKEQQSLGVEQLKEKAARLGLDGESFNACLDSGRHAGAVAADLEEGGRLGVTGTPAMFINGRFLSGAQPFEAISAVVSEELEAAASGS